jgi:phosphatidylglycerol:prolipoprotein diacylglycerol transferase
MHPPVNPILFQIGPFALHWYGITMTSAIFFGALVASRYVARHKQDPGTIWDMLMWVLIPAIVGARLYYVFIQAPRSSLSDYLAHPIQILEVWNGGIHIYGAFILGGLTLIIFMRVRKLPYLIYFDAIGLGLMLGQAIGRIGNFINQELYGPPTTWPWGLLIDPAHRVPQYSDLSKYPVTTLFQPLFLYEMVWDLIGFFLLLWVAHRFSKYLKNGDLFLLFLIWSPFGRFFVEFWRTDSWFFPGTPFNLVHILAAISVIGASIVLYIRHRPGAKGQTIADTTRTVEETEASEPLVVPEAKTGTKTSEAL